MPFPVRRPPPSRRVLPFLVTVQADAARWMSLAAHQNEVAVIHAIFN